MEKPKYYSLQKILETDCRYNIIIGERSNGKTYACLEYAIKKYFEKNEQFAYIRRYKEDYRGKRGAQLFAGHESVIKAASNGEYSTFTYYASRWYPAFYSEKTTKTVKSEEPAGFAFALSDMEHDKSASYPNITTVIFDEFLTRDFYFDNEFIIFCNVLSTIIRDRDNVKIFMLGNTVSRFCPYFKEMGLSHITEMQKGKIDIYCRGDSKLRIAVEYCDNLNKEGKKSDVYFAFDNIQLEMIKGGEWELAMYPHLPRKYDKSEINFIFFIDFDDNLLQCEVISSSEDTFIYIHRKTTPITSPKKDIIFTPNHTNLPNVIRNIRKSTNQVAKKISKYFKEEKIFYQDNEVGEIVRSYLMFCISDKVY